jgi:hypothetical protein
VSPEAVEELCSNICSLAAHPCANGQGIDECMDACRVAGARTRGCSVLESLLRCYERLSFDLDPCSVDVDATITRVCSEETREALRECPDALGDPGSVPPPDEVVVCEVLAGEIGDDTCSVEATGCSDGRTYGIYCRVDLGTYVCVCPDTGNGVFYSAPLMTPLEELCSNDALSICRYQIFF